jgi:hypothetical protein
MDNIAASSVLQADTSVKPAIERGFVIRSGRAYITSNKYFDYCMANELPFIAVRPLRVYAAVSFDAISMEQKWHAMPVEIRQKFAKGIENLYKDLHNKKRIRKGSVVSLGLFYICFHVYAKYAKDLAKEIGKIWKESNEAVV